MNSDRIHTSDANPGDVLVRLSFPHSNQDSDRTVKLEITDRMSGTLLTQITMTGEQFTDLMSCTGVVVGGAQLPPRPERIGKRLQTTGTNFSRGQEEKAERARDEYLAAGWDTVRIERTNYGCRVVARRWVAEQAGE